MTELMQTQAGDAGAFRDFDLSRVPTPCFVVDEVAIERNLAILKDVADRSGAHVLSALKAFSMFSLAPLVRQYLGGTCASGIYEARLGREEYGGEVATFCAGYKDQDIDEILSLSDHIIFNSPAQKDRFLQQAQAEGVQVGLRINPEHSEGEIPKYDPCAPCSRLGTPVSLLTDEVMRGVDGIHMHTLCEQGFEPLARTWAAVEAKLAPFLVDLKWVNFGGGHHITRADYDRDALVAFIQNIRATYGIDVYLEPGEAVALDAGILVGEILDLPVNDIPLAITDISATCHMPDVIEAPYRPALLDEAEGGTGQTYRLGGPSCLAGDVIGDYSWAQPLEIGQRFAFLDQAHYSMVKTNTFNGVPLPGIALWNSKTDQLTMVKSFTYEDFKERLS
ncbi:Carboxynorspermidine/carboxyspermidine decarboxylase [Aliiroseovarius sp. xm-m-379]|uniref:carboxynorspermidine decarboxylase n=1 Tax=unclassified Aliiroseovarius TaxID=2623558 RepID=UPI001568D158|nr:MULTISPECIES: carboxynorspermidine decarboxylase [unclassified Aliiroseovarius]NRP13105.1 Carboxynorspermidine/carboxyspermidine decarboxylase [Aliiroseovarius sp. xm-d-517]NRP24062.1 Carboxynorspermidine/carboxyspermidine decarboxylase [Aliiroseovarius sp. xm-m-379]NRP30127.1 Carboxynorspermidine/carboxyspermidine decarboxylase [Aliiroseovarius sp. xm-m-314]NRP32861.1 Carboxynorspermidine/carboxyspermidine decarboxylase [Aliiroseovarius sp. xm-a-104]NRP40420.1 Carboxynorspermidine/carboxys